MDPTTRNRWSRFVYAAKVDSWPKLLVPALLGQAIGLSASGRFSWAGAIVGVSFTVFGLLFIVLINDYRDRQVDAIKRRMFPDGCSPKTIPDAILSARSVFAAGMASGAIGLSIVWLGARWLNHPQLMIWGPIGLAVFAAYTLPPIQLNYRGGGELLETLGVGIVLPIVNAYTQTSELTLQQAWMLPGYASLCLASAVASGLSDEASDRAGGKTTVATRFGNVVARRTAELSVFVGLPLWMCGAIYAHTLLLVWVPMALVLWHARRLRDLSDQAVTNAFSQQKLYKRALHFAIWGGTSTLAASVIGASWLASSGSR